MSIYAFWFLGVLLFVWYLAAFLVFARVSIKLTNDKQPQTSTNNKQQQTTQTANNYNNKANPLWMKNAARYQKT